MSSPLRVVIAEDNYLVREGTRRLLEDSAEVDVVAAVGTANELIDAVERLRPQAVLTDIRMPPGHRTEGIEAAHRIRAEHPQVGVVVLSQHADEAYAFQLFRHGTSALALSESAVEKHVNAIFSKLGLSEEPHVHRRVAAVLTYLRDSPRTTMPD